MNLEIPSTESQEGSGELLEVKGKLEAKGIDPEKVAAALEKFTAVQRGAANEAIKRYNEAAQELADSMGMKLKEGQHMKFPQMNMGVPDSDVRRYLQLSKKEKGDVAGTATSTGELPPELL
jgi:hypothetical protein